jgi:hypothetical protein
LRRPHDHRPARGVKARRALRGRTVVAFHEELDLLPTIAGETSLGTKFLRLRSPNSTWTARRGPEGSRRGGALNEG